MKKALAATVLICLGIFLLIFAPVLFFLLVIISLIIWALGVLFG